MLRNRVFCTLPGSCLMAVLLFVLTLSLMVLGARFAQPSLHMQVDGRNDQRFLARFHAVERNELEAYRWSQPVASIFLYGFDGRSALVDLRLTSPRPPDIAGATVTMQVGQRDLGTFAIAPERNWRRYQVIVPTHASGDTALVLRSNGFQPGYPDTRELGLALSQFMAWPVNGRSAFPLPQRALFLLSLPVLAWLLVRHSIRRSALAAGVSGMLAVLAGLAAAYPLTAGYLLPTIWWPWWPFLPFLILIGMPHAWQWLREHTVFASPWIGLGVIAIAILALRLGANVTIGLLLLLVGTLLTLAGIAPAASPIQRLRAAFPGDWRGEIAVLTGITLLALGLRLYQLDVLPAGLWRDEARHGLLALRIWQEPAFRPIYVVGGADLPALLFYLMAPIVGIFGPHVWSARLVSAIAGGLTPLALWWAARPLVGPPVALTSAALLAWASWSLSMSRWAFPATLDPLFMLTAVGLMWRALARVIPDSSPTTVPPRTTRPLPTAIVLAALAGVCAGLAAYTYHTGRMGPITLAVLTSVCLGRTPRYWRRAAPLLAAAALAGLLALLPLLHFIAGDWDGYNRRVSNVTVLDSDSTTMRAPLSLLLHNTGRYLLMWHVAGERNGRHHAPGAPMLDPLSGMLLVLGLGVAIMYRCSTGLAVLLLLLVCNLVPGLLSGNAPHAMRSIGVLAPACVLAALGLSVLCAYLPDPAIARERQIAGRWLAVGFLAGSLLFNTWLYFGQMAHDPAVYNEFYPAETAMARIARAPSTTDDPALRAVQVFLPRDVARTDTVRFLTSGLRVETFDGTRFSTPPGDQVLVLVSRETEYLQEVPPALLATLPLPGAEAMLIAVTPRYLQRTQPLFQAYALGDDAARLLQLALE